MVGIGSRSVDGQEKENDQSINVVTSDAMKIYEIS